MPVTSQRLNLPSANPSTYKGKLYNLQLVYFLDTKKSYLQGFSRHRKMFVISRHFWKISEQKIGTCPKRKARMEESEW